MTLDTMKDPTSASASPLDPLFVPLVRDERDVPLLRTAVLVLSLGLPIFVLTFASFSWWFVPFYVAFYIWAMGPATLMIHNVAHRPLFGRRWADRILITLVGALLGHTPGGYMAHHLEMHHREDNGPDDLSSTLQYQRDSWIDFARYLGRFLVFGPFELATYLWRKGRKKSMRRMVVGELTWLAGIVALATFNLRATIVLLVIPTLATRFLLMAGNWAQHAFIDPDEWDDPYRSVTTFVDSVYNQRCFNDGYHLLHHLRSGTHWTELPGKFVEQQGDFRERGAAVFRDIDYFEIWLRLMVRDHRGLADRLLVPEGPVEERISMLQRRCTPIDATA